MVLLLSASFLSIDKKIIFLRFFKTLYIYKDYPIKWLMKDKNIVLLTTLPVALFLIGFVFALNNSDNYPKITNQWCDALNRCENKTLECYSFPDIGLRCAEKEPCSYYQCPKDSSCIITASYPGSVDCDCTLEGYRYNSETKKCEDKVTPDNIIIQGTITPPPQQMNLELGELKQK